MVNERTSIQSRFFNLALAAIRAVGPLMEKEGLAIHQAYGPGMTKNGSKGGPADGMGISCCKSEEGSAIILALCLPSSSRPTGAR